MSAICGILRLDTQPVSREMVAAMSAALAHRGPHGEGLWTNVEAALGHRLLRTTPESVKESQPVALSRQALVLVADARIDNRRDLIASLGLRPGEAESDAALILAAYARWGDRCPEQLIGDFAFAIYDSRRRELFCARDPMGVKPFYYFAGPSLFAFGSEIKALFTLPEVPRRSDTEQLKAILEWSHDDHERTVYRDVRRLPAAHTLTVSPTKSVLRRYWKLEPNRELRYASSAEYVDEFREIFIDAVRARVRSAYPVASTLSGGLDSSSITCVARELLAQSGAQLQTYSLIFPELSAQDRRLIDEREFMASVIDGGKIDPHFVRGDELSPLQDLSRVLWHLDEPHFAPNLYLSWGMYGAAAENGARVFLDGLDGDTTVSHGFGRLVGMVRDSRWDVLESEVRAFASHQRVSPQRVVTEFCLPYLAELARGGQWRRWVRVYVALLRRFELSGRTVALRYGLSPLVPAFVTELGGILKERISARQPHSFGRIRRELHARVNRTRISRSAPLQEGEAHRAALARPINQLALELGDRCAAAFHVEPRYPFFDRRLIEFCVAVPAEEKFADGWPRLLLRRAMQGILPADVQWRTHKGNLTPNFVRRMHSVDAKTLKMIDPASIEDHVDATEFQTVRSRFLATGAHSASVADATLLFRVATVATWITNEEIAVRPSVTAVAARPQTYALV